jgi:phosphatidate cytidylyltransferase
MATASSATPGTQRFPDLSRRVAYGVVLAAVVVGSIVNLWAFVAIVLFITLGSLYELAGLTARKGQALVFPVAAIAVASYIVLAALGLQHTYERVLLAGTLIASLAVSLFIGTRRGYIARSAYTLFSVLYIGWLGSYFVALRTLQPPTVATANAGAIFTIACVVLIALTDIFAMLVGSAIGRTPLNSISPKKTWEGAIGGFLATVAVGAGFGLIPQLGIPWWDGALIGAITSVAAQAGDLVESALKRDAQVKDAGTFLGSHGGILDRFDSYTFGGIAFYGAMFLTHHILR